MKLINESELDVIESNYSYNYKPNINEDFFRDVELTPFVYPSNKKNIKKIVISIEFTIKDEPQIITILKFITEQEFLIDNESKREIHDKEFVDKLLLKALTYSYIRYRKERLNHSIRISDINQQPAARYFESLLPMVQWEDD
jgi:hypothetical protein